MTSFQRRILRRFGVGFFMPLKTVKGFLGRSDFIEIRTDLMDLQKELKRFSKTATKVAQMRAINRGLKRAMTVAKKEIADKRYLSSAQAKEGLTAVPMSSYEGRGAMIIGRGRMLPLTKLKTGERNPKQLSRGTKVTVSKGRRILIESAFVQRMPSGHKGVFLRKRIGTGPRREARLPIQQQMNPSIAHTLTSDEIVEKIMGRYEEAYERELEGQLTRAVARSNLRIRFGQ